MSRRIAFTLALACALALVSRAAADDVVALELTGTDGWVEVGRLFQLRAVARLRDGSAADVGSRGEWSIDDTEVMDGDHRGFLSTKPGTAVVTFRYAGRVATRPLIVTPKGSGPPPRPAPAVGQLAIELESATLEVGQLVQCHGRFVAAGAAPRLVTFAGRWTSSQPDVVAVGPGGELLARAPGTAELVLEFRGVVARRTIAVRPEASAPAHPTPPDPTLRPAPVLAGPLGPAPPMQPEPVRPELDRPMPAGPVPPDPTRPTTPDPPHPTTPDPTPPDPPHPTPPDPTPPDPTPPDPPGPMAPDPNPATPLGPLGPTVPVPVRPEPDRPLALDPVPPDPVPPGPGRSTEPRVAPAATLRLDCEQALLDPGDELVLRPAGRTPGAAPPSVGWSSSCPLVLESVGDGRFRAIQPGRAVAIAEAGGGAARCEVVVRSLVIPASRGGATLDRRVAWVAVGQSLELSLAVRGADQTGLALWTSSQPTIVRPRGGGHCHAAAPGAAVVQARFGAGAAACLVVVLTEERLAALRAAALELDSERGVVVAGETWEPPLSWGGAMVGDWAEWSVEPAELGTFEGGGFVGRAEGLARLVARIEGKRVEVCVAVVAGAGRLKLVAEPAELTLRAGVEAPFRAWLTDEAGGRVEVTGALEVSYHGSGDVAARAPGVAVGRTAGQGRLSLAVRGGPTVDVPVRVE